MGLNKIENAVINSLNKKKMKFIGGCCCAEHNERVPSEHDLTNHFPVIVKS